MKLIRLGEPGNEYPGVLDNNGRKLDVRAFIKDYDESFFSGDGIIRLKDWLQSNTDTCPEIDDNERMAAPVARPSKIVCVGLNYAQHAKESGMELPPEPLLFFKSTTSICGPYDDVIIPKDGTKVDWEVELAIVIGKKASYIPETEAINHVAGYVLHNDVSERNFQLERGGQWVKGKSADTFAPLGPYLVTPDEIPNPHNLDLWLKVNGETLQHSNTSDLVFGIPQLISSISGYMTLLPGDIISTGTPFGVGLGFNPPRYLNPGDEMELSVEGLGVARQRVKSYKESEIQTI